MFAALDYSVGTALHYYGVGPRASGFGGWSVCFLGLPCLLVVSRRDVPQRRGDGAEAWLPIRDSHHSGLLGNAETLIIFEPAILFKVRPILVSELHCLNTTREKWQGPKDASWNKDAGQELRSLRLVVLQVCPNSLDLLRTAQGRRPGKSRFVRRVHMPCCIVHASRMSQTQLAPANTATPRVPGCCYS